MGYNWPVEYGGTGWSATQLYIFNKEFSLGGCPPLLAFGVSMVAPVIYTFGNDEQKKRFLPDILDFNTWWCHGYSEPGSGSDLASLKTKAVLDNVSTSLANSAGGLNSTHTISVAGIYDTVGESIDTRTVTIAANASAKLISDQLNAQMPNTNVGFTAKTGVVISDADNDNEITFKLSNNNGGTALISANITTDSLENLKTEINLQTGTTGITATNGVVAQDDAGNPIWTLGNDSLLLTHSSGEDIAITELTGVALNVRIANFDNTTYEDEANEVSLQAARNLIVNPITSDQQVVISAENNSLTSSSSCSASVRLAVVCLLCSTFLAFSSFSFFLH